MKWEYYHDSPDWKYQEQGYPEEKKPKWTVPHIAPQGHPCPLAPRGTPLVYTERKVTETGVQQFEKTGVVIYSRFDWCTGGTCGAFRHFALVFLDNGDCINPGNSQSIDCEECPVLKPTYDYYAEHHCE